MGSSSRKRIDAPSPKKIENDSENREPNSIWIGGVTQNVRRRDLRTYFQQFGEIVSIEMVENRQHGFIKFKEKGAALFAVRTDVRVNINGTDIRDAIRKSNSSSRREKTSLLRTPPARIPCKFHKAGLCEKRDNCRFWHQDLGVINQARSRGRDYYQNRYCLN